MIKKILGVFLLTLPVVISISIAIYIVGFKFLLIVLAILAVLGFLSAAVILGVMLLEGHL